MHASKNIIATIIKYLGWIEGLLNPSTGYYAFLVGFTFALTSFGCY